ncbi:MAG: lipoyl(octanoyl) transferase LipB [Bacteroidetes bacterium]|nr:MAG: lipoyl(octanoyl) transferase LipB [Bacteroidota bacterium]
MNKTTYFRDLGKMDYKEAWDFQEKLFREIIDLKLANRAVEKEVNPTPNYLLFVEHPHVYTLGKNGSENNLLINHLQLQNHEATFHKTDRGGDITYHGPGQIVGYPILDLDNFFPDIHKYVAYLEEAVIQTIAEFGLKGERLKGASGVWLDADIPGKARKICAIGIRTSRWVTMHGFAFNVNTDLKYFEFINPCGFNDKKATSMQKELNRQMDMQEIKSMLKTKLGNLFEMKFIAG